MTLVKNKALKRVVIDENELVNLDKWIIINDTDDPHMKDVQRLLFNKGLTWSKNSTNIITNILGSSIKFLVKGGIVTTTDGSPTTFGMVTSVLTDMLGLKSLKHQNY